MVLAADKELGIVARDTDGILVPIDPNSAVARLIQNAPLLLEAARAGLLAARALETIDMDENFPASETVITIGDAIEAAGGSLPE